MARCKCPLRLVVGLLLIVGSLAWCEAAVADTLRKIHLVLVGDTGDATIGKSVEVDLEQVADIFRDNLPKSQLTVWKLSGGRATEKEFATTIKSVRGRMAANNDVLVIYISSHGAFDSDKKDHFAHMKDGGKLYRTSLRNQAAELHPRLTVILSDTCSVILPGIEEAPRATTAAPTPAQGRLTPAFRWLFLEPKGVVDISATRPGESALGGEFVGGFFTSSFCTVLASNAHQRLAWDDVLTGVNGRVQRLWPDARQTAYALLNLPPAGKKKRRMRFGVVAERTAKSARFDGVEVTRVIEGTPAESVVNLGDRKTYWLVPGSHIITHVNGKPTRTEDEFEAAVEDSSGTMRFRVRGLQTERTDDYEAQLMESKSVRFGVTAERTRRSKKIGGVEVTGVMPGYPGTRITSESDGKKYTLEPGVDFITHVNGREVSSYKDLRNAVRESSNTMRIRLYDSYHKSREEFTVELDD